MESNIIYLDSYTLQSDARIRLPKSAIENLKIEPGKTRFKIYFNTDDHSLILRMDDSKEDKSNGR